jgi:hypothetical protein
MGKRINPTNGPIPNPSLCSCPPNLALGSIKPQKRLSSLAKLLIEKGLITQAEFM